MEWRLILLTGALLWVVWYFASLLTNYNEARKTGFPIIVCPLSPNNPIWMVTGGALIRPMSRYLPTSIYSSVRCSLYGWEWLDQLNPIPKPGLSWILVTPSHNELWAGDPEVTEQVLARRKDFFQGKITKRLIGIMGQNVMTLDGHDWQRNRKIVAQALNERIMNLVWEESRQQATDMAHAFVGQAGGETNKIVEGLRQIAINVLASAGYGNSSSWKLEHSSQEPPPKGHEMSYVDVLVSLTAGFILVAFVPSWILSHHLVPKAIRKVDTAAQEFRLYTKEALVRERQLAAERKEPQKHFLSSIVDLSDREKDGPGQAQAQSLSEDEIQGNLFQFTLAGFDTTANTMAYAVTMLTIHPQWQAWIIEEIDFVSKQVKNMNYGDVFPQLHRCLALMCETLRLFTPVANPGRFVHASQTVTTSSGTYHIPKGTQVYIGLGQMHVNPHFWGSKAREFLPSRWIEGRELGSERCMISEPPGVFVPWSSGARLCPGMKMAQVEFCSVMFTLFQSHSVKAAVKDGESAEMARKRILSVVEDSQPRLSLQMNRPDDVELVWEKRTG